MTAAAPQAADRRSPAPSPAASAVERLTALLADDMAAVNGEILARMDSPVARSPQLARYIVASGGKRLRPLLTLAAARLCGYGGEDHVRLAAAVEFIHTATLLHDDVVDESGMRRGKASANEVFGNEASVLVGDFLFARSFQLMVATRSVEVLRILSNAAAVIAEGEVLQLSIRNDISATEPAYLQVVEAKTAALFAAACEVGPVVADRPAGEAEAFRDYGLNLGIAFQIIDDVLDYSAHQGTLGKAVGDDFREGKLTLPVILALRGADATAAAEERAFWARVMESPDRQADGDLDHAMALIKRHGALEASVSRAWDYAAKARAALGCFAPGELREILLDTVDAAVDRAY